MKKLFIITFITIYTFIGCDSKNEIAPKEKTSDKLNNNVIKDDTTKILSSPIPEEPIKKNAKPVKELKAKKQPAVSEIKSISGLWRLYKSSKAKVNDALETNDLDTIITYLKIAGECAVELGRPDIASWQFNNIGHYSILEFQRLTGYEKRMRELATMNSRVDRTEFINDTKIIFSANIQLLLEADKYLVQAQIIDDELESSRRTETIERNRDFINWVKEFADLTD